MMTTENRHIGTLRQWLVDGKIDRREFLRSATLLGLSAGAAYAFANKVTGGPMVSTAHAQLPKGGVIRIGMRCKEIADPHTYDWAEKSNIARQVCEYLTKTGVDNVTRPYLLEKWEASDDLKTWTLHVRKDVKWHDGRALAADDVIWNIKHVLDPATGSSVLGLMKGYMLKEVETGEKDEQGNPKMTTELWDANAIEKVDDHTIRLNAQVPQLAVPEHFFHYPFLILDPEEGGKFGPGSNGTGPFELKSHEVNRKAVLAARKDYWGQGPNLEGIEFIDLGDDPSASVNALTSQQVHGLFGGEARLLQMYERLDFVQRYEAVTAETGVVRGKVTEKPFDDARVRKALRLAVDSEQVLAVTLGALGSVGEHHHVCSVHPEYAKLPIQKRDVEGAKRLLTEAGYPDGVDLEVACAVDPEWQLISMQVMVQQWKEAGIRVKIKSMPGAQYWDVWDKVPFGYTLWYHRPLGVMIYGLAYRSGVPWNESSFSNPEFDRLLSEAEGLLDVEQRRQVMAKLEHIMQEEGPIVQPLWRSVFTYYDKKVKGFRMHPSNYIFGEELALGA
jgi:peptide/nickel transport system substrate-binding protein